MTASLHFSSTRNRPINCAVDDLDEVCHLREEHNRGNLRFHMQVYELNKGTLKLVAERETEAGIKCCTFGASSLEERHLVRLRNPAAPAGRGAHPFDSWSIIRVKCYPSALIVP